MRTLLAVRVFGPFLGATGYEHHVREFVRELTGRGIAVHLTHMNQWSPEGMPPALREPWFERLSAPVDARVALHFCMPHQVKPVPGVVNVNFTMFESNRIPASWAKIAGRLPMTIVPNAFCRDAWIASGVQPERVRVCPLGVRRELFAGDHRPMAFTLADGRPLAAVRHRFLNVSAWDSRKNIAGLINVWKRATSSDDDAVLVLKTSGAPPGMKQFVTAHFGTPPTVRRGSESGSAPIHLVDALFSDQEMPGLYAAATHYISLSHGEGWDLPMMEAAATGLTPIAPDHSAYRTYLSPDTARLIPSKLVLGAGPRAKTSETWFAGLHWWEPDRESAVQTVRGEIDGTLPRLRPIRQHLFDNFGWERAGARLVELLSDAERFEPQNRRIWPRLL